LSPRSTENGEEKNVVTVTEWKDKEIRPSTQTEIPPFHFCRKLYPQLKGNG
jgi:hypothetical protein